MSKNTEWIYSDLVRKAPFIKKEFSYFFSRAVYRNVYATIGARAKSYVFICRTMRKLSTTKQRCKCRISGRARHVHTLAGLSRMPFRFLAGDGYLNGIARYGR